MSQKHSREIGFDQTLDTREQQLIRGLAETIIRLRKALILMIFIAINVQPATGWSPQAAPKGIQSNLRTRSMTWCCCSGVISANIGSDKIRP